jgi:hypothetical protein
VLEGPSAEVVAALRPYASSMIRTGERVRLEIPQESEVQRTLEIILRGGTKLISVNPVKRSLEDYFLQRVGAEAGDESMSREVQKSRSLEVESRQEESKR